MHANVDLIQRGFDAFASGDMAALTKLLSPDVVWVSESGGIVGGRFEGRDEVFANWAKIPAETAGTFRQDVQEIYADDRVAVARVNLSGTRRDKSLDGTSAVIVFVVKDGVVTQGRIIAGDPELNDEFWAE
jgi:uncharacterized protein